MRTTLNTMYNNIQGNLNRITTSMTDINERISSGHQMSKLSDNPVNLVSALRFRTTIAELDQFNDNITHGSTIITAAESALTQMKDLALRAKTLSIQAADPALSSDNMRAIAKEINQMFQQSVELGNTQINGQFIFGGQRTTGYTDIEPAPFIIDKGDGHWINGTTMSPLNSELTSSTITPALTSTDLAVNDLLINGEDIGAVDLTTAADVSGINMVGANNLNTAINAKTTVYANNAATADTTGSAFTFNLNNIPISVTISSGSNATAVANTTIAAITAQTAATGVTAVLGTGGNGGPVDSVVFKNAQTGDNSTINVSNFTTTLAGGANPGFGDFSKKVVTATLTTQTAGAAATLAATGNEVMDFSVNGTRITYKLTAGTIAQTVQQSVDALNQASQATGVTAQVGNGSNGGPVSSIVLTNTLAGDESDITLANLGAGPPNELTLTGLLNGISSVGAGNNNGKISLSSAASIDLTTSGATAPTPNDTILNLLGLGGGGKGNFDEVGDGKLAYGYPLSSGDLEINGIAVPATTEDGLSTVYSDASATAKAAAINSITSQTGVTADVLPAEITAAKAVNAGTEPIRPTGVVSNTVIRAGELSINSTIINTEISNGAISNGLNMAKAFNAKTEINKEFLNTKVDTRLTTLLTNNVAATKGTPSTVDFTVNGTNINLTTGGVSATNTAKDVVDAVNAVKDQTGVVARIGTGKNGGAADAIVLYNNVKGNEAAIVVENLNGTESGLIQLANNGPTGQAADINNNTGEISFDSEAPFSLSSPLTSPGADIIINELGFTSNNVSDFGSTTSLTGTVTTGAPDNIPAGNLYVNGVPTAGAITGVAVNGINMAKAASAKTQIEASDPNVSVKLTTMTQSAAATSAATANSDISFNLNGESVNVTYSNSTTAANVAQTTVTAINKLVSKTGVMAYIGTGASDGTPAGSAPINTLVFKNISSGDDSVITVSDMTVNAGNNNTGLSNFTQAANATHNNGEIKVSSNETFDLSTPLDNTDATLNFLGLGLGASTGYSEKADGLVYGSDGTGDGNASFGASPEFMTSGDLIINGVDIFKSPTAVLQNDKTNAVIDAINTKTATTQVKATRGTDGVIHLNATDGRNVQIQTSANGEDISGLTGGKRDAVFFGTLQLNSDRKFTLKTINPATNSKEPGLAAIGMAGGSTVTGETGDLAGDGKIDVFSIHDQTGTVRYAGDRENDLNIKIGKTSTMKVGDNGQTGVANTTIFTTLKDLEDTLQNKNFTSVTGIHNATDTSKLLNSKDTGLEPAGQLPNEDLFSNGSFTVNITDHDFYPPKSSPLTIGVDTSVDSLDSITKRIDGIPHLSASWNSDGQLEIKSDKPSRYTIDLANDSSNFLTATGVAPEFMQRQGIDQAMNNLDSLMNNLTEQVSNFGARANRIDIQTQIYSEMNISTKENLSEVQDTDMIKAVMELKAKETAYQAALSAASKAMQLSLVDYLR